MNRLVNVCSVAARFVQYCAIKKMLTNEDFTSNETVDSFQIKDATIDMIGYVTKMNNNVHSSKSAKFHKFVLNNGSGREVKVIAWNNLIKKLSVVKEIGSIVHVGSVMCSAIKNNIYNSGNVQFELLVKDNTTVDVYDVYKPESQDIYCEEVSISEAYDKVGCKLKLEGIIKVEPRVYQNMNYMSTVASITDCESMVELKINFDCSSMQLTKGTSVQVNGVMEQHQPGPPILRVDCLEDIKILNNSRVSFADVVNGFRTKNI